MIKRELLKPTNINLEERKKLASSIMKNLIVIGKKKFAWIPVELLNVLGYQRNRQKHVIQIAENWDDAKCNVLLVSYDENNGTFNVMDGQHRAIAARMRGVEYLVCEIFTGLTVSSEAKTFVCGNTTTKKLTPFDIYRANQYIAGDDETELSMIDKEIARLCKSYNIIVEKSNAKNTLKSVTEARSIIKKNGSEGLQYVIETIIESGWNEYADGFGGDLTKAIGVVYSLYPNKRKENKEKLISFFKTSNPAELVALGNNTYPNSGRRARLQAILNDIISTPKETKKTSRLQKLA